MMEQNELNLKMGQKLKQLRRNAGLTLLQAAEQVGCSAPFLSMVENGHSSISLSRLQKLLKAYGRTMADLTDEALFPARVVSLSMAPLLGGARSSEGVEARLLANRVGDKKIEPIWFRLEPNAVLGPLQHEGEEFCFVLEGRFEVTIEDPATGKQEHYHLSAGDTVYYESHFLHTWRNASPDRVGIFLGAVTPPSF